MKAGKLTYHHADSIDSALALNRRFEGMGKFMAGGQSLMPMMNLRMAFADQVIDISRIAALREVKAVGDKLFIGAGITHAMIEDGKVEDPARGYLRHVAAGIAYRSIRNRGTVGGSLAHADPAADWPTALRALDAVAVIRGADGTREVTLAEFQVSVMETSLADGELLQGVLLPRLSPGARWAYQKFCHKVGEFAHSIGAVVFDPAAGIVNVVLGAVGGKPVRLAKVSARLADGLDAQEVASSGFMTLLEQDLAASTSLDPASYDFQVHKTIIKRAVMETLKK
ncbi:FAD binding domain-containing protein [Lacisediminimonas profundi]|uniref:FAD binding domain-containing protein n=1 Tax=Lacisediminimonas profundi TaxID=2603856 RepID=UPI00124B93B3|nr:FAD binding domain-containing protein [Lacisediminimonas profundi]